MKKLTFFLITLFFLALTNVVSAEFIDNGDGTVTDTKNNLIWQQAHGRGDWDTCSGYCSVCGTGGYSDWRMPTLTELQLLVDINYYPAIDPVFACSGLWYWTNTVKGDSAWTVVFDNGVAAKYDKSSNMYVRCVRGSTTPANCATVDKDLNITIPCLQYNGQLWEVKLDFYSDPLLPAGLYWKFKSMKKR